MADDSRADHYGTQREEAEADRDNGTVPVPDEKPTAATNGERAGPQSREAEREAVDGQRHIDERRAGGDEPELVLPGPSDGEQTLEP